MRRGLTLALVAVGVAGLCYLAAVEVAVALAPESPLERGLEEQGFRVTRAPASALPDLRGAPQDPALVVLVHPASLSDAERDALRARVEAGGVLWVLSSRPSEAALWDGPRADAFPGFLYASTGAGARLALATGDALSAVGFFALDLKEGWTPVLTADATAFRDTNGNRVLDRGEPAGPFVVAAEAVVGEGRVLVVGTDQSARVPMPLAAALARDLGTGDALVLDGAPAGGWTAAGRTALALAALPAGSLVAAGVLLLAAAALLALALLRGDDGEGADAPAARLAAVYADRIRARGRPEDKLVLQSLQGDSPP